MVEELDNLKEGKCVYCKNSLTIDKARSEWDDHDDDDHHYKSLECDKCGKKNWCKVCFYGSGHDCVLTEEERTIDSVIKRVMEG